MTEKLTPQYATIEQPFGCDPSIVHCPICGSSTMNAETNEMQSCPHLAFIYICEISEFVYQSDDFKTKSRDWYDKEKEDDSEYNEEEFAQKINLSDFRQTLANMGYDNNLLAIELTSGGMACGPVYFTDVYGFDYESLSEDESSSDL